GDTLEEAGKPAAPEIVMTHRWRQGDCTSPLEREEAAVQLLGAVPSQSPLSDPTIPPRYLIGTPDSIQRELRAIAAAFETDEIMIQCISNNLTTRLRCLKLLSEVFGLQGNGK